MKYDESFSIVEDSVQLRSNEGMVDTTKVNKEVDVYLRIDDRS